MKKRLTIVSIIIAIIIATLIVAVGCTVHIQYADPVVKSIAVDGVSKVVYVSGDKLDISGATLIVTYDDGKHKSIPLTEDMLDDSSYDMNVPGEQKVIVVYEKVSTFFTITIEKWVIQSVTLGEKPYVTEYVVGEEIDPRGATIECKYEGNKYKFVDVTSDMLEPYDNQTVGKTTIYATYYGQRLGFEVEFADKTPISIKKVDDASDNYVFVGKGENFKLDGMTVKIGYDNNQETAYDVKKELENDVFVSIDDSSKRSVDAVLMYYPSDYKETYKYRFYGVSRVSVGDIVEPGQELATNELERNGKTIPLDPVTSKSYGTVKEISHNEDGSRTLTVNTSVSYELTRPEVKPGDVIADKTFIGNLGTTRVYAVGGGRVASVDNGLVTIKTAPTFTFVSNVKEKSFSSMELLSLPTPTNFVGTTINDMIEGDTLDKSKGYVRVTFDDGSQEEFRMDDENNIKLVNDGKDVGDTFSLVPGRNRVLVVYGEVLSNSNSFIVRVESKYPIELKISDGINGRTYYLGDRISVATMTYSVAFNNGTTSKSEPITEDMVDEGYSLECSALNDRASIAFKLPSKYEKLLPDGNTYIKPVCSYAVRPQPVQSVDFVVKPVKVYVGQASDIVYSGASLDVYYRNNTVVSYGFGAGSELEVKSVQIDDWNESASYDYEKDGKARLYVFTLRGDNREIPINEIVRRKHTGYEARATYVDEYGEVSQTSAFFKWFKISGTKIVSGIKITALRDKDGKEYYKKNYTQYEDWDLSGLEMTVTYKNGGGAESTEIIDELYPEMIYGGNTNTIASDVQVKFAYLGAIDDTTLKINVSERKPVSVTVEKTGKTRYVGKSGMKPDFSEYSFILAYNAGPSERISGSMLSSISNKEISSGFWYRTYNSRGEAVDSLIQTGTTVYELCYSYPDSSANKGYSVITTVSYKEILYLMENDPNNVKIRDYTLEVVDNTDKVISVSYEQNVEFDGTTLNPTNGRFLNEESSITAIFPEDNVQNALPVLAESAVGWEIMLSEYFKGKIIDKMLTVVREDATGARTTDYVKITPAMLDYDVSDRTIGYRRVTITYMNLKCEAFIYVWRAELTGAEVEIAPLQNYIYTSINSEDDLDLTGGIIRLTFNKYTRRGEDAGKMNKYVDMDSKDFTYSGFVKGLYSKEGENITINAVYKDFTAENLRAGYTITVYDRQDVDFSYNNVIFFYGNASPASYNAKQGIPEFFFPSDITLNYIESKNLITLAQYLSLDEKTREYYVPVTVYDENEKFAPVMFVKARKLNEEDAATGDIREENYLDPVYGSYYVKYGTIYMIAEEDYDLFEDADKAKFSPVPTYGRRGQLVETFYVTADGTVGGATLRTKINAYSGVIVDKITAEEYDALSDEEKAGYEEESNVYFILMCVTDDRPLKTRFYETANYALRHYAIIQKVIEVRVEDSSENAKVLRVSAKKESVAYSGNPYAIYYLHNPALDVIGKAKEKIESAYPESKNYINSVYLASPNEKYFEIVIRFTDSYVETEETKIVVAELYYEILSALLGGEFKEETGVELSHVNFDGKEWGSEYDFNPNDKTAMVEKLKSKWYNGINVFDKSVIESGEYNVSYALTFGDTKTRNGVLQLLDGNLVISKTVDENGRVKYTVEAGTLWHRSYTVDLTRGTITEDGEKITVKK